MTEKKGKFFNLQLKMNVPMDYNSTVKHKMDLWHIPQTVRNITIQNFIDLYNERKNQLVLEINKLSNDPKYKDMKFPIIIEATNIKYSHMINYIHTINMTRYQLKKEYSYREYELYRYEILTKALDIVFGDMKTIYNDNEVSLQCIPYYVNYVRGADIGLKL